MWALLFRLVGMRNLVKYVVLAVTLSSIATGLYVKGRMDCSAKHKAQTYEAVLKLQKKTIEDLEDHIRLTDKFSREVADAVTNNRELDNEEISITADDCGFSDDWLRWLSEQR